MNLGSVSSLGKEGRYGKDADEWASDGSVWGDAGESSVAEAGADTRALSVSRATQAEGDSAGWARRGRASAGRAGGELGRTGMRKGSGLGQRDWLLGREKGVRPGLAFPIFFSPFLITLNTKLSEFKFKF